LVKHVSIYQDEHAAVPEAFHYVHFDIGKWIASIGAMLGFSARYFPGRERKPETNLHYTIPKSLS